MRNGTISELLQEQEKASRNTLHSNDLRKLAELLPLEQLTKDELGRVGTAAQAGGPSALPCLYSNNSIQELALDVNKLTGGHRRMAFVLRFEIEALAKSYGINRLGFLTLTFAEKITSTREAQRRFNSLNTNILKARYERAIACLERCKSKRLHFHLVVVLGSDIRTGFDFQGIDQGDYRSASACLRQEWSFWRETAKLYGFGRTELLPIKSTVEGIAFYVGKYISKHTRERQEDDKGARLVRFIGFKPGDRHGSTRFSFNTPRYWLWRHKLKTFAKRTGCRSTDDLVRIFGPRWAYHLMQQILGEELVEVCPSVEMAVQALEDTMAFERLKEKARELHRSLNASRNYQLKRAAWKPSLATFRACLPSQVLAGAV